LPCQISLRNNLLVMKLLAQQFEIFGLPKRSLRRNEMGTGISTDWAAIVLLDKYSCLASLF
jgi:hypothetical protein